MRKNKIHILYLFLTCLSFSFAACGNDDEPSLPLSARTVLVYVAGDNSLDDFVADDLAQMKQGIQRVDVNRYNLLVYIDDGSADCRLVRLLADGSEEVIKTYPPQNSVGVDVMRGVLADAFDRFRAESYGLVLWSHGDGWLPGTTPTTRWWGQDLSGHSYLGVPELHTALRSAPHLDFLLFDACFMQAVEVAYELRDRASYIIGSPTEIPGPGAPYQTVVPAMLSATAASTTATATASAYYTYYADSYNDYSSEWSYGASVATVDTDMLDILADATRAILSAHVPVGESISTAGLLNYDRRSSGGKVGYYDLDRLIHSIATPAEYSAWRTAFDAAVTYAQTTPTNYSMYIGGGFSMNGFAGLSTYVPGSSSETNDAYYRQLRWAEAVGW
ncbi:MAG: hypothetical protein LBN29_00300 [Mediterranea sp.]|jgi:hypothetical protein|nr:hypothetical protein [Mediterranea sp.]